MKLNLNNPPARTTGWGFEAHRASLLSVGKYLLERGIVIGTPFFWLHGYRYTYKTNTKNKTDIFPILFSGYKVTDILECEIKTGIKCIYNKAVQKSGQKYLAIFFCNLV